MNAHDDKYRIFRNFMVNELGIGRDDIKAWTQEAVSREVEKIIGQINVNDLVHKTIDSKIRDAIRGPSYRNGFSDDLLKVIREAVCAEIAGRISFVNPENKT